MFRLKSPSVITPTKAPLLFTIATAPKPFFDISRKTLTISVPVFTVGISLSTCIMFSTVISLAPKFPPGCSVLKRSGVNSLCSIRVMAKASPKASVIVVDVVGTISELQASFAFGRAMGTSAFFKRLEEVLLATPINGILNL